MEILAQRISTIDIRLIQDADEGVDDITPFITSLPKLKKLINKIGYGNPFSKEERGFWITLIEQFSTEGGTPTIQQFTSDKVEVTE